MGARRREAVLGSAILVALIGVAVWLGSDRGDAADELAFDRAADVPAMELGGPTGTGELQSADDAGDIAPLEVPHDGAATPADGSGESTFGQPLRVIAPDETPVEGARAAAYANVADWRDTEPLASAVADAEGRMTLALPSADLALKLHVTAEGHHFKTYGGERWSGEELVVELAWAVTVTGVARDAESGTPVPGATVGLRYRDETVRSDADGRFAVHRVPVGIGIELLVRHPDYAEGVDTFVLAEPEPVEREVLLRRGVLVPLTVVDRHSGALLPGVELYTYRHGAPFARTDTSGRYELRVIPGVRRSITFVSPEHVDLTWTWNAVDAKPDLAPRVPLQGLAWVEGRVTDDDGEPLDEAWIRASNRETGHAELPRELRERSGLPGSAREEEKPSAAITDAEGLFRASVIPADTPWQVSAHKSSYVRGDAPPLDLRAPGETAWVELALRLGGSLRGRVRRGDQPYSGTVHCRDLSGEQHLGMSYTGPDGEYEIEGLPAGELLVQVGELLPEESLHGETATVVAGEVVVHDLWLEGDPLATIGGQVVWPTGLPVDDVTVTARPVGGGSLVDRSYPQEDGRFSLDVPAGTAYELVASRLTRSPPVVAHPGDEDVRLVLPAEGSLVLQFLDDATGAPPELTENYRPPWWLSWRSVPDGDSGYGMGRDRGSRHATIDVNGRCEVLLPIGLVELSVDLTKEGYLPLRLTNVPVPPGEGGPPYVARLRRGAEAELRFVDDATGEGRYPGDHVVYAVPAARRASIRKPLPGEAFTRKFGNDIEVVIDDPELSADPLNIQEDGHASVRGLAPGRHVLVVFPEGSLVLDPPGFDVPRASDAPLEVRYAPADG